MDSKNEENAQHQEQLQPEIPLLYKDRPEWNDVKPIYNSPEENAVVRIATSEEFDDAFAYLRAVMKTNELSERTLELTKTCISLNAANYSVWHYRREILRALGSDILEELQYCEEVINENPKNYQVWHHRKTLVDQLGHCGEELDFTALQLQDEPKNYHAWQYRQWLIERFNQYSAEEMNFSTQCIYEDIRNNSAWNYRYFIGNILSDSFTKSDFLDNEIKFTLRCILRVPSNESAWSYLSGILINDSLGADRLEIVNCCEELMARQPPCTSPHLYVFLIDSLAEKIQKCGNGEEGNRQRAEHLAKANQIDVFLVDPPRNNAAEDEDEFSGATEEDGKFHDRLFLLPDGRQVRIERYGDEKQLGEIMDLIGRELSEPYSIYTYRYFIHYWPDLCILARNPETGKIVGVVICKMEHHQTEDANNFGYNFGQGYIAMLAVEVTYRGMGLGTKLVKTVISVMERQECDEIVLETEVTNTRSLSLYGRLGFIRDCRLYRYYLNGNDAFRLKLYLDRTLQNGAQNDLPQTAAENSAETNSTTESRENVTTAKRPEGENNDDNNDGSGFNDIQRMLEKLDTNCTTSSNSCNCNHLNSH